MGQPNGETGTTTPPGGQGSGNPQGSAPPAGTPNNPPAPPASTFTQADVERIVKDRLEREKAKYADYEQLRERAAQWDKFVAESQSDQEKALAAARKDAEDNAWAKARSEYGSKLVTASLQAAAAGRMSEAALTALLAGVDKSAFLTQGGDVDTAKVSTFMDGIAPTVTPGSAPGGFGQGTRPGAVRAGIDSGRAEFERRQQSGGAAPLIR